MKQTCKVGNRVIRNLAFLKKIAYMRSKKRILRQLDHATPDELLAIVEIASNILSSNFCISTRQRKNLYPYADYIRKLARIRSEKGARKIIQKGEGSFIPALLLPVVIEVARYYLNKNK